MNQEINVSRDNSTVEREAHRPEVAPAVDVYDAAEAITLVADMPGVAEQDLEVTLERSTLTIRGKALQLATADKDAASYAEYRLVDYYRAFSVSSEIDGEHISAKLNAGVLRLTLPKRQPNVRKIEVLGA
ncbi:MAG: Hsp20/alpha crystallin family protein [Leptospirales bacterium]|nr:Hsp20/alpha crystallin family protein [Leptospirales bacterium]